MSPALWIVRLRGWLAGRPFERAARDPEGAQRALLERIVRANRDTAFGRAHGFEDIADPDAYRARVPIRDYEGHRDFVDRVVAGEARVLTAEAPFMFASTSGTTRKPKWVPVTESWRRELASLVRLWIGRASHAHPKMLAGKVLTVVSPAVEERTPLGMPVGSVSGLTNTRAPWVVRRNYALPSEVSEIEDYDLRYYVIARLAAEKDVSVILTPNPGTLHRIAEVLRTRAEEIVQAIATGTLGPDLPPMADSQRALVERIEAKLRRNPRRAAQLQRLRREFGALLPRHCWTRLRLIGCWLGGSSGVPARGLRETYGDVPQRDLGFRATEGTFTVPLEDHLADGPLALHANFYEFVPVDDMEAEAPASVLAHEVRVGRRYYMIFTTCGGLYRYDINDVVEVTGHYHGAPVVRFLRKGRDMTSMVGEKLHVNHLLAAAELASTKTQVECTRFQIIPDPEASRYDLLVEPRRSGVTDEGLQSFAHAFDQALMEENPEYPTKRKSGRLLPPRLVRMRQGWADGKQRAEVAEGRRDVQYKWRYIERAWDDHARAAVLGPASDR